MTDEVNELDAFIGYLERLKQDEQEWVVVSPSELDLDLRYSYTDDEEETKMTVEGVGHFDWKTFDGKGIDAFSAASFRGFSSLVIPRDILSDEADISYEDDF